MLFLFKLRALKRWSNQTDNVRCENEIVFFYWNSASAQERKTESFGCLFFSYTTTVEFTIGADNLDIFFSFFASFTVCLSIFEHLKIPYLFNKDRMSDGGTRKKKTILMSNNVISLDVNQLNQATEPMWRTSRLWAIESPYCSANYKRIIWSEFALNPAHLLNFVKDFSVSIAKCLLSYCLSARFHSLPAKRSKAFSSPFIHRNTIKIIILIKFENNKINCWCSLVYVVMSFQQWKESRRKHFYVFQQKWKAKKLTHNNNNKNMFINLYFMYVQCSHCNKSVIMFSVIDTFK